MERTVFHIDVNSAFLSWEAVYRLCHLGGRVDLRKEVAAVGGDMAMRHGIILAKSIPAKKYHIQTGESITEALQNPEAAKFFNGDCCGDDFYYTDIGEFRNCVEYWLSRYEAEDFVRWSIQDKERQLLIGTIEVCPSLKYAVDGKTMGILRIDLKSDYERQDVLEELLDVLLKHIYEDFQVASVLMKIQRGADERQKLIRKYCFVPAKDECNISFSDYYVSYK